MMPGMDGIEATRIMRDMGYTKPIVALTANAIKGQADLFLANGFDDFLSKPIDTRQLNAILNKYIREDKPLEQNVAGGQQNSFAETTAPQTHLDPQLAELAVRDATKALDVLEAICRKQDTFGNDDFNAYIVNIHAMKSVLMNIGETDLSNIASQLETACKNRDISVISNNTPLFLSTLRRVIEKIKPK